MSIFTKPLSKIETADLQELLADGAVENIRLEFKSLVPDKEETLKKLSSFANSFGGFMVVGAKANSADGKLHDLPGVDVESSYKQKVVTWCFDGAAPPLTVEVSEAIPVPSGQGRVCYVIHASESDLAPHFLNGRKGIWVRTDEFSQRFEARLATENELRHLLDRRSLIEDRRSVLVQRSRNRFDTFRSRQIKPGSRAARLELSIGPRFPSRPLSDQAQLSQALQNCRINWRGTTFPYSQATFVSQHESVLFLTPAEMRNRITMVEANIWGLLFYASELEVTSGMEGASITGIHLYNLVGHLLVFTDHAQRMTAASGYSGPISIDVVLSDILNVPWLYTQDNMGLYPGPVSELDDAFSFSLQTSSDALQEQPDALAINMLQYILFAMNWSAYASNRNTLETLVRQGYDYNFWDKPTALRL